MSAVLPSGRADRAWWALILAVAGLSLFVAYSFVGTLAFGLFLYYAVRPINRRVESRVDSPGTAAGLTMAVVVVPLLAMIGYVGFIAASNLDVLLDPGIRDLIEPYVDVQLGQLTDVSEQLRNPRELLARLRENGFAQVIGAAVGVVGMIANGIVHLFLMLTLVYYLLADDHRIAAWFRDAVGGRSTAHAYLAAVDTDLASVYFSNIVFISLIGVLSVITYTVYNLFAPAALHVPLPVVLGVLTGIASIVPIVVGKLVYVPVVAYLYATALAAPDDLLVYPTALLAVAFLFLDFIPLTFVLPYIAGRNVHRGLMVFAYIGGTLLFGWYGIFLGPILVIGAFHLVRYVIADLLRGEGISPEVSAAPGDGSDPVGAGVDGGSDGEGSADGADAAGE
jgi:predicted PurR-regulated permease PerM